MRLGDWDTLDFSNIDFSSDDTVDYSNGVDNSGDMIWQTFNESPAPGSSIHPTYAPPVTGIPQVSFSTAQSGSGTSGASWLDSINRLANVGLDIYKGVSQVEIAKDRATNPYLNPLATRRPAMISTVFPQTPTGSMTTQMKKYAVPLALGVAALFLLTRQK